MRAVLVAVGSAIVLTSTLASTAPLTVFSAAVVRRDGVILPIGTFTGHEWEVSWPAESHDKLEIPLTLDAVPKEWWGKLGTRARWQLWSDGAPGPIVNVVAPKVVKTMCSGRVALNTDYRSAEPWPATAQPFPKAGIAVSPPAGTGTAKAVAVARVEILDESSPERRGIGTVLKQVFDNEEDRLAMEWTRAGDPHPIDRKERIQTPLTVEAMYATDDGPDRLYYVEASRKYDHANDDRAMCVFAFGSVYFRKTGSSVAPLAGEMKVVPCNRRGLVYMLPLGAVRLGNTLYWFTQYSGWDFEQYNILAFEKARVQVAASTFGGRCDY